MALLGHRCHRLACATLAWATLTLAGGRAQVPGSRPAAVPPALVSTQEVYAAFTVNLTRFVTWPEGTFPSRDAPIVIGSFPRDAINAALDEAVKGESVEGHPLRTMRIQSLDDLAKCQVVFLSKNNATRAAVLSRLAHKPVLTVSDADGFLELGGHVWFEARPPHTRPRISPENLKLSGLEVRSQLLRLAAVP
jgi:hypothetical protein